MRGEFDPKDERDIVFLLTIVNLAGKVFKDRKNISDYFKYAINHQDELLILGRELDNAIKNFNSTSNKYIDPKFVNIIDVRAENSLGEDKAIPLLLGENQIRPHDALSQFESGMEALDKQNIYMQNSELSLNDAELLETIKESGSWSEIHLKAKTPKHFLATFIIDLYPGMIRRWLQKSGKHRDLDTDELVRALCESLDRKSMLFNLINDQGWFVEGEFSKNFVKHI